ncbi:MAG: zinc ribbon domain-containing protein [Nitrospiraceae bacterium]
MTPQFSPLIELQKVDLRIAEIRDQQRKLPERLDAAEAPLRRADRVLKEATAAVEALVKERRAREKDLEVHEEQTDKLKARASQLKTNQEYQAHLFEVELAQKKKGEIEDKILVLMEQIEQMQRSVKESQSKASEADRLFKQEKTSLEKLETTLTGELTELGGKQRALAGSIDKSLLDRYSKLKATRKDQALAAVRDGMCCGCRLQVPPQLIAEVKRSQELHTCPYCHRILYWEGPLAEEKASPDHAKESDLEVGETA